MPGGTLIVLTLLAAFAVAGATLATRLPDLTRTIEQAHPSLKRGQPRPEAERRRRGPARPSPGQRRPAAGPDTSKRALEPRPPRATGDELGLPPVLLVVVAELALGGLALVGVAGALACKRLRNRRRRPYERYEIHLSNHDEAKPQDLEDMVEGIANVLRALPVERARDGQPFCAFELHYGYDVDGQKVWTPCLLCPPGHVAALGGAISAAYPDVRVGYRFEPKHNPITGRVAVPGAVMRFRKDRPFVYPLASDSASGRKDASPLIEAIAQMQCAVDRPSTVRLQVTPAPAFMERFARHLLRREENKLVGLTRWGVRGGVRGGLGSEQNRAEMRSAQEVTNRSILYLEAQVAADEPESCKRVAAALQARRGENRLQRRTLVVRAGLYRRRFPNACPPLLPSPRSFVSAAELSFLLELPSARVKNVPVRRTTAPHIPGPPEGLRTDDEELAIPEVSKAAERNGQATGDAHE